MKAAFIGPGPRSSGVPVPVTAAVAQIHRRARARYGDAGGEMLPVRLPEDLTGIPLRLPAPAAAPAPPAPLALQEGP
jgi:hypothetical protein